MNALNEGDGGEAAVTLEDGTEFFEGMAVYTPIINDALRLPPSAYPHLMTGCRMDGPSLIGGIAPDGLSWYAIRRQCYGTRAAFEVAAAVAAAYSAAG